MLDCIAAYSRLLLPTPTTPAALAAVRADGGKGQGPGLDADREALSEVVRCYLNATQAGQSSFSDAAQALALLPLPGARAACRRALAALDAARRARRGALPTLRQLRYLLLACLADAAHQALVLHGSPSPELAQLAASRGLVTGLSPADLRAARDGLEQAVRAMVQQEPDNPKVGVGGGATTAQGLGGCRLRCTLHRGWAAAGCAALRRLAPVGAAATAAGRRVCGVSLSWRALRSPPAALCWLCRATSWRRLRQARAWRRWDVRLISSCVHTSWDLLRAATGGRRTPRSLRWPSWQSPLPRRPAPRARCERWLRRRRSCRRRASAASGCCQASGWQAWMLWGR